MTGTFEHRVVYVGRNEAEAKRCSVCGSPPDINWIDVSLVTGREVMWPRSLSCPNGPHEMSDDEYRAMDVVTLPAPPRPGRDPGRYEGPTGPRRRWWRR